MKFLSRGSALAVVMHAAFSALFALSLTAQTVQPVELTLARAIEMAQSRGPAAGQALESREAAFWRDRSFNGRLLPQVTLSGTVPNVNRSIIPVIQPDGSTLFVPQRQMESSLALNVTQRLPFTGGDLTVSSDLTRVDRYGQTDSRLWRSTPVQVSLRQSVLRPNSFAWDKREQGLRALISERQYLEAIEDIAISTVGAFFEAFSAEFALRNATNNVALNDTLFKLAGGRFEVGKIGENDLQQSELALVRAQIALDAAKMQKERALGALRIALRLPEDAAIELVPPVELPEVRADTAVAIAEALRNRSQVLDLELQETQSRRRVSESRRASGLGATVTATAGFNQSGRLFDNAYRSLLQQQRFGVNVQVPLFLGGSRSADIHAALAEQRRADASIGSTMETLRHEVRFAALEMSQTRRQVESSAKADTLSQLFAETAKNRFLVDKLPLNEFYQAQNARENAHQAYMQALRAYWQAYYRLRRLTLFDFAAGVRIAR